MTTVLKLFMPGQFEDVQAYMGQLIAFTVDGDVKLLELENVTQELEKSYSEWSGIATPAFARNDWLGSGSLRSLARNTEIAAAIDATFERLALHPLDTDPRASFQSLSGFQQLGDVLLDTLFYASRLYLGTNAGFFSYDIDWQQQTVEATRQRLDARAASASAAYGAVNVSCEADGLFTGFDEVGWRASSSLANGGLRRTAGTSLRSAWYGHDVFNYESSTEATLLRATVEQVRTDDARGEVTHTIVTELKSTDEDLASLVANLPGKAAQEVQFAWNSSRTFLVNTDRDGLFGLYWASSAGGRRAVVRSYGKLPGRVVAVHPVADGLVIETDFSVYLLTNHKLSVISDEEPLTVRTFAASKRYRRLVAVTVESGVYLLSLIPPAHLI